jgi:hypothetical protein
VQPSNGGARGCPIWHLDEAKAARAVGSLQPAANSHHLKTGYNTLISALV